MPKVHYRPLNYIKTAILWSLYYLRNGFTYEEAVKDIISKGGDTTKNAAIVGALMGAANGITEEQIQSFEEKD
jgi:ADP-ribosylglycohydrolase